MKELHGFWSNCEVCYLVCESVFVNSSSHRKREKTCSSKHFEGNVGFLKQIYILA
jgi:hypothetical protein